MLGSDLGAVRALCALGCAYDRAAEVVEELMFGPGFDDQAHPLVLSLDGAVIATAVTSGPCLRFLAVHPRYRQSGWGTVLLRAAEGTIASAGFLRVRVLDQAGNYLAPGVDVRNRETIAWFERRGYTAHGERVNLIVRARDSEWVTATRAEALASACSGYRLRRAGPSDRGALDAMIRREFSAGWAFEADGALGNSPPAVHIALAPAVDNSGHESAEIVAFSAHDGNNRGLGWFGPAGTVPAHRGRGLGAALLCAALLDIAAAGHDVCEIAWIGPRGFYERHADVCGERRFVVLRKELS